MRIRTDDEVYRVDAVWLGPPKATFPWRARYVAWGVGTVVFLVVLTVFRQMEISLFWSIGWGLFVTILLTMIICSRISHERPLGSVLTMWVRELSAPREVVAGNGGAVSATQIRVRAERPRRKPRRRPGNRPLGSARSQVRARTTTSRHRLPAPFARLLGRTSGPPSITGSHPSADAATWEVSGVRTSTQA